jgi:iron complex outermembrane receptor protein
VSTPNKLPFALRSELLALRSAFGHKTRRAAGGSAKGLFGALVISSAAAVHAQEAPAPAADAPAAETTVAQATVAEAPAAAAPAELEEIIVTGSSIRREDAAALPVTIVSKEEMDLRDAGSPVDLLTSLPAVANVPINESTQGGAGARGDVAAVALRGLGSGSTLVLLNGRRMAAHGITSNEGGVPAMSVNANVMPARGLERVDVLRDGASSIYGSDAVAGVINFITDSKFIGNEIEMQAGFNEIGSGNERRVTLTHGDYYFDEKLHWTSTFDYYDRDATESGDVAGDSDKVSRAKPGFDSLTGAFFDRNASGAYPSFRIGSSSTTNYLVPTATGAVVQTAVPARTGVSRDYYYDMNTGYALPQSTRFNFFNAVDYKVNDKLTLFGEALLYSSSSKMKRPPIAYGASSDAVITLAADNPFNPYGSRFYAADGSANADGSARLTGTPQSLRVQSYRFTDVGNENVEIDTTAYRFVFGGRGNIVNSWNWESAAMFSRAGTRDVSQNAIRESSLQAAIASGAYNPLAYNFGIVDGAVVATTPYANSQDSIDSFTEHFVQHGRDILGSIDARVTGELFDTWAGPVQLAVGGEHRWDDYALTRPQYAGLNGVNDLGLSPTDNDFVQASSVGDVVGDRTIMAGFAETVIPLASPFNEIPLINSLSVGASVRYEDYSDFGDTTNPKFTLDWRPIEPIMIRASYNEGFRAPNLAMTNYPSRSAVGSYTDPYRSGVTGLPSDGNFQRLTTTSGNPDLKPETSKGKTLGVVVDVPFVDGLRFSVDYFNIKQKGLIAGPDADQLRADDAARLAAATQAALAAGTPIDQINLGSGTDSYAGNPLVDRAAVTQDDIDRFAAYNAGKAAADQLATVGALLNTSTPYTNLNSAEITGYDFNITYNLPTFDWGKVGMSTDWTYLSRFRQVGGATGASSTQLGISGAARVRGSFNLFWSYDTYAAGVSAYYIGEYADTAASITDAVYQELGQPDYVYTVDGKHYWKVDDSVTFNAFASKTFQSETSKMIDGLTVRLGVKNLTDEKPPLTSAVAGYDASVYNSVAVGRTWTVRLAKSF